MKNTGSDSLTVFALFFLGFLCLMIGGGDSTSDGAGDIILVEEVSADSDFIFSLGVSFFFRDIFSGFSDFSGGLSFFGFGINLSPHTSQVRRLRGFSISHAGHLIGSFIVILSFLRG